MRADDRRLAAVRVARAGGFTLLELLVVIVLAGVLAAMVAITPGQGDLQRIAEREAHALASRIEFARDEAIMSGEQWGVDIAADGYRFLRLDERTGRWTEVRTRPFGARDDLPVALQVQTREDWRDRARTVLKLADAAVPPDLLLLSSGETSEFTVRIAARGSDWQVTGDGFAGVEVRTAEPIGAGGRGSRPAARGQAGS